MAMKITRADLRPALIGAACGSAAVVLGICFRNQILSEVTAAWVGALGTLAAIYFAYRSGGMQERARALRAKWASGALVLSAVGSLQAVRDLLVRLEGREEEAVVREADNFRATLIDHSADSLSAFPAHELADAPDQIALAVFKMAMESSRRIVTAVVRSGMIDSSDLVVIDNAIELGTGLLHRLDSQYEVVVRYEGSGRDNHAPPPSESD